MLKKPSNKERVLKAYTVSVTWDEKSFNANNKRLRNAIYRAAKYSMDTMNSYYVPKKTGELINSSKLERINDSTVNIVWTSDYAAKKYYEKNVDMEYSRGPFWFDRMISVYSKRIEEEANKAYYSK